MAKKNKIKTCLILGGGGTHGATEVGVLKVLAEKNIIPQYIIGTSIGSFNGAFFAQSSNFGQNVTELAQAWMDCTRVRNFFPVHKDVFFRFGRAKSIYDTVNYEQMIERIKLKNFLGLCIPLFINCTKLDSGKSVFISKGNLKRAILASSATVPFFPPVAIDGSVYIDGGFSNYLGSALAQKLGCGRFIVVETPTEKLIANPRGMQDYSYNAIRMLANQLRRDEIKFLKGREVITVYPRPARPIGSIFDFKNTQYLIQLGEREARRVLAGIKGN